MDFLKDKHKRKGIIATVAFHLLLLFIFIFYGLTYTYPPPLEGILINFGTSDAGMGDIQPDFSGEIESSEQETLQPETSTSVEKGEKEYLTQEESPVTVPSETEEEKQQRLEEERKKQEEEAFEKKMADVWNKSEQSGGSEGETGEPGDQGDPDGSKDATSHIGGAGGKGYNYSLKGRNILSIPKITDRSQEEGKVVVNIIVDRKGNVIRATPTIKGSTTTSKYLWKKAKEAAFKAKFSSNLYSPEEQKGVITFVFILE